MISTNSKRTVVIIPALNEADSVGKVIDALPDDEYDAVIVVDNGSTDNTAQIAIQHGAIVLSEPNRGYGQACLTGIAEAGKLKPHIIVFLDADFSDYPEEISSITAPIKKNEAEMVIGSRTKGQHEKGALLPQARFGNWLASFLIQLLWRFRYSDLGPFRAITWEALEKLAMQDKNYGWTVEMQIKALQAGFRVKEVPVSYRKRIGKSKVTGTLSGTVKASYKILWTIFKYGARSSSTPG